MSYKYDLFISYASEDKDFVRPLAESLRAQRLAVWFDEFELVAGKGLRESIDKGLLLSRFGLVVLSPSFFLKSWPRWELDGLVQLAHSRSEPTIIPIWHKVNHTDVATMSPSLANIVAIPSFDDPERATGEVLRVLRPRPTAVEVARDVLNEFGFPAPVLSDDWWLDAAVWSAPSFGEGTFQEASSWGWWGFPLPALGDSAEDKGERIAWAAMQHSWQEAAMRRKITQCTSPTSVIEFIRSEPGLETMAESNLDVLLFYVPQLGIPGTAGPFEPLIDSVYREADASIKSQPTRGAPGWILRHPNFCNLSSDNFVCRYFWPTDPACTSPDASVLAWVDAAAWLVSNASTWLPPHLKAKLVEGLGAMSHLSHVRLRDGRVDIWDIRDSARWTDVLIEGPNAMTQKKFVDAAREVFRERVQISCELLGLTESANQLVEQIVSWGVFDRYWAHEGSTQ